MVHCLAVLMPSEHFVWHVCSMDSTASRIIRLSLQNVYFNNKWLQGAFALGAVLITVVLTVPGLHLLFKVETLDLMQLGCVYLYAFASLPIIQLLKWIRMKLKKREEK